MRMQAFTWEIPLILAVAVHAFRAVGVLGALSVFSTLQHQSLSLENTEKTTVKFILCMNVLNKNKWYQLQW